MKAIFYVPLILTTLILNGISFSTYGEETINAEQVNTKCLTSKWHKSALLKLKENKFELKDKAEKEALALQLLNCLANPDAEVRDGIAFETLSYWLREEQLSQATHLEMYEYLSNVLKSTVVDSNGVYQTFAALMLSEIARVDRKVPFLTDTQRENLVYVGTSFLTNLRDYRGFSSKVGWRHGVAHSSDLMLQLALNPKITKVQLDKILAALASQIAANEQHAYIHGEPKRMAMAVIYVFLKKEHTADDWSNWLNNISNSLPLKSWQAAYQSEQGLIKLHNTQNFLVTLYAIIKPSKNETVMKMIPA